MSHTIVGIDLGAHAVKFALVEAGFRQARLAGSFSEAVPHGDAPLVERQGEALQRGLARLPQEVTLFVAVPGELLTLRVLDLPFSDPRKIDQVVGYELEGQIVHALADVVYDHVILQTPGPEGTQVLTVAAKMDDLGGLLADLGTQGIDPRSLFAAPAVYQSLLEDQGMLEEGTVPPCRVVLDVGHLRTNVCVLQGTETVFARTLLRGGAALTAAVARAYQCDEVVAAELKHEHGFVASAQQQPPTREAQHMDTVLRDALAPLMRDLRQTLASVRSRVKTPIESILLTGGGSRLTGLAEYLQQELDLQVTPWTGTTAETVRPVDADPDDIAITAEAEVSFALASAIAWAGARGRKQLDLRRGPFVYKASFSLLRQKAMHLGALAAALVIAITVDVGMALARLSNQRQQLQAQLKAQTQELFGEPRLDGRQVAALLRRSFKDEMAPLPKATAFDLLDLMSKKLPPADKIKLDITDLEIRPKKVSIKGTVDSSTAVDDIVAGLNQIACFKKIIKGLINEVSGGAKSFTLTIDSDCP